MHRRGTEVDLRYGLRILEGISNHRRSCRVLWPVQEQCQQCIVTQTYPSARKAEEKSILQLCVLPDSCTKVLAQVIAIHFNYTSYFTQQRSHSFRGGFKPYKYMMYDRPSQGEFFKRKGGGLLEISPLSSRCPPITNFILYSKMVYSASLRFLLPQSRWPPLSVLCVPAAIRQVGLGGMQNIPTRHTQNVRARIA